MQYIAWPDHTWEKRRKESPGKFESAVAPAPDPDEWFRARIDVTKMHVKVYVNGAKEPTLVVERLARPKVNTVGLLVDVHEGSFADLIITPR